MKPITFIVPGEEQGSGGAAARGGNGPAPGVPRAGIVKHSIRIATARGGGGTVAVTGVPGEDIVVLHLANGPELVLHPETARDLMLAQSTERKRGVTGVEEGGDGAAVTVPTQLEWRGLEQGVATRGDTRGVLGGVVLSALDIVKGPAADVVVSKLAERFDEQVNEGVYLLQPDTLPTLKGATRLAKVPAATDGGPLLALVHGTFSNTSGTFEKLWTNHPQRVQSLFNYYGNRVYALDHATLGSSPIANALTLARALPDKAKVHLVTHSRGGLVAEVFARALMSKDGGFAPFQGDAKYAHQLKEMRALAEEVKGRGITAERIVRVACPARGTLLASKRLDAYLSVLKWSLQLAGIPVAPQLVDFLNTVAQHRTDPDDLPGLAAQIPDSPLVQWLHAGEGQIDGQLRVVAGDLQGDSVTSWLKTLLADSFYWTDNDLVVQTRSMYGGSPRKAAASFVLDQGGQVSHFNYFTNERTAAAIVDALVQDAPQGFRAIGPLSWGGTSAAGVRAALVQRSPAAAAALPALFVLPGILGSNLRAGKDRVWLGWRLVNGFDRLAYGGAKKSTIEPDGPVGIFYDDLATYLSADHDVIPFAFDWRRPIEDEANRLADAVDAALDARKKSGQPVRMIAHSMGGLVARAMQLQRRDSWARMMKGAGARILMLGTPNGGSWAPMQVLSGDDTFGNMLSMVGAPFRGDHTRQLIAEFPGLMQLQAGLLDDLGTQARWKALADADIAALRAHSVWHRLPLQLEQFSWGIPSQQVLDRAVALRKKLDRQRDTDLAEFAGKLLLVVGKAALTPAGYQLGAGGLVYLDASDHGDGRVTLQSALLPGVETWTVDCEHGDLPRRKEAFEAYRELLRDGKTGRLAPLPASQTLRGAVASTPAPSLVRSRPARALLNVPPPQRESEVLASTSRASSTSTSVSTGFALRVTVVNGDLTYVADPLLIGHYRSSKLTGAEAVMDRAIGGAMSASLRRGLYPVGAGTHQVFVNTRQNTDNPWQLPRPAAVIVAGLGPEGELRGTDLVQTVRQAVIAWGQRLTERAAAPPVFSLATTLLGSGGSGVSAGQAAQLIAQGVREANDQLSNDHDDRQRWPRVDHLQIIELYLDRASEAWRSLQALAATSPALYAVTPKVEEGIGALRRPPDFGYRGADYDFISALIHKGDDQEERIFYSADTKRARSEVRAQTTQLPLIRNLVSSASNNAGAGPEIGRTLFRLLVPVDLEPLMGSSAATVLELDGGTAGLPWELLDTTVPGSGDDRPWAIRTKLLRKLRTAVATGVVTDASAEDGVLVIGDPACDRSRYPKLFGARLEAAAVAACFSAPPSAKTAGLRDAAPRVNTLISPPDPAGVEPDANAIINATMAGPWRIVHVAGHGEPPIKVGMRTDTRGVVLSGESFLGPTEIGALRVIPELVFVNCCYLATGDVSLLLKELTFDRPQFASGVAEALINVGVRCVVAAGWAVDDEAARVFATTFYSRLLEGCSFIDAVAAARAEARACGGNTWAAYQCYGDPDWKYRRGTDDAQRPSPPPPSQEFAGIASVQALVLALDTLAVKSEFQGADTAEPLRYLEQTFQSLSRDNGRIAEAFGNAWSKLGKFDEAIGWYERARVAPDSSSSLAAIEQLANAKVRRAWERVAQSGANSDSAITNARGEIADAMALIDSVVALGRTVERESIYGSAYKRLALVEAAAGRADQELDAIAKMKDHYAAAEEIARAREAAGAPGPSNVFYPAMNRIAAQLALEAGTPASAPLDGETIASVRRAVSNAPAGFWSVVGQTELSMFASISSGALAQSVKALVDEFQNHFTRVSAVKRWASVHDNATFVLAKYQRRAAPEEARAAGALLERLAQFAGRRRIASSDKEPDRGESTRRDGRRRSVRRTRARSRHAVRLDAERLLRQKPRRRAKRK